MIRFIAPEKLGSITTTRGLDKGRVLYRLHRYYCKRMDARGRCDMVCEVTCKENLERIFRTFDKPNDPYALLVWRCREAVAKSDEEEAEAQRPMTNLGRPIDRNVFEFLAEEYESEAETN